MKNVMTLLAYISIVVLSSCSALPPGKSLLVRSKTEVKQVSSNLNTYAMAIDEQRLCRYVLSRERRPDDPRWIITVHEQIEVRHLFDGTRERIYRSQPCDIWVDANNNSVFEEDEHYHLTSSDHKCRFMYLPGQIKILTEGDFTTLEVLIPEQKYELYSQEYNQEGFGNQQDQAKASIHAFNANLKNP